MIRACPVHKTKYCIIWVHIPDPQHFGNVGQQVRPNHFGPFLVALTESWKEDCKCYGTLSESDLKRTAGNAFLNSRIFRRVPNPEFIYVTHYEGRRFGGEF